MIREDSIEGIKIGRPWPVKRVALDGYMKSMIKMAKHDLRHN